MKFLNIIIIFQLIIFSGCSFKPITDTFDKVTDPDYVNSSKARKLEIPPDLSEYEASSEYGVPGEATSYKDFSEKQNTNLKKVKVLDDPEGMRLIKSGNLRWLVVNKSAEDLWPFMEKFWENMGFSVKKINRRTGVMETEWIRADEITGTDGLGYGGRLDRWLDELGGQADERKFRTRLEKGYEANTTEIYLSHRKKNTEVNEEDLESLKRHYQDSLNVSTIYKIKEYESGEEKQGTTIPMSGEVRAQEIEINAEVFRRLMIYLGLADRDAKEKIENPNVIVKAELVVDSDGSFVSLNDPFDRAWRRLSIALDMIGFITEDKNRSEGIFYVKYINLDILESDQVKKSEDGLLDTLAFWRDDEVEKVEDNVDSDIRNKSKKARERRKGKDDDEKLTIEPGKMLNQKKTGSAGNNWSFDWWGSEDEKNVGDGEKRYRIRIVEIGDGAKVFIDYPDGSINKTITANSILNIIYEHLR